MKVILLEELKGKGGEGDILDVRQGYAENHLFPKGIAIPATQGNLKQLEQRRRNIEKRETERIAQAEALKAAVDGKTVKILARVGEEGQLFGSVTTVMIADAVEAQLGVTPDRKRFETHGAIKTAGEHSVELSIYREIRAQFTVEVCDEKTALVEEEPAPEAAPEVESEQAVEVDEVEATEAAVAEEVAE